MAVMHTVVMTDTEYRFTQGTLEKMSRDSVFAEDAKKLGKIFRRDIPVSAELEPAAAISGGTAK